MGRPCKANTASYRLPTFHLPTRRWRLRIEHAHGEKTFWWPGQVDATNPPPGVIAAAVAVQDEWRLIREDWFWIKLAMRLTQPDRDWSKPVWMERSKVNAILQIIEQERVQEKSEDIRRTLYSLAVYGVETVAAAAHQPNALALGSEAAARIQSKRPDILARLNADREGMRLQVLADLKPAPCLVEHISLRDAIKSYIAYHEGRTKQKAGDVIGKSTFKSLRKCLLHAFGLSAGKEMAQLRSISLQEDEVLDLDQKLAGLGRDMLDRFARFWHGMPDGLGSSHTVRNRLQGARSFFNWCADRPFGFTFPQSVARLYTAAKVETPAELFDAARMKRILKQAKRRGGTRLKLYVLLGLLLGYTQADICEIRNEEFFREGGEWFIKRFRSKERKPKRGRRPVRIKHWVAPELAAFIEAGRRRDRACPHEQSACPRAASRQFH